ncbi:plasmid mobilization protein [Tenacibaculum agarivorans]|uniref:plasmid mobilization protein n=1 Tax=Tenacibaculum agarivorans TaxID=1908389 RepID=UPI000AB19F23|nr:hypothetical protein [Tenacibaculum agarivorans]
MPTTFQEFLQQRGKANIQLGDIERDELYKEHRRLYFRERNKARKQSKKRIELWYSHNEYKELKKEAQQLEITVAQLLRDCIEGYREKRYVRSKDKGLQMVCFSLNKWGNLLNQLTYRANAFNTLSFSDIAELKKLFHRMNERIENELQFVPLEDLIRSEFEKNPRTLDHLETIINHLRQQAC